jgi:hypothetical protein
MSTMREFAKSALSFSWALSLLGINSAANMLKPDGQKSSNGFAPVTEVAVGQLNESMRGIYQYGDNIQTRLVDTVFSWMNPASWANMASWNFMRSGCPGQASGRHSTSTNPHAGSPQWDPDSQPEPADATGWGSMPSNSGG